MNDLKNSMNEGQIYSPKIQKVNQTYEMKQKRERKIIHPKKLFCCFEQKQKRIIPLRSVKYNLKIYNGLQIVQLEQIFSTEDFNQLLDLEYVFCINENAAVTKMKVELGEQIVYGIVKEKEEAKKEFEEGIKQGKTMAYSEEDEQIPQIKRLKIGQLAPNKQLRVIFEYIQPLKVFLNKFWKIDISPIIDENYQNNQSNTQIGFDNIVKHLNRMFQLKDFDFKYSQDIEIEFDTGSPITFWKSPTHSLHSTNAKDIEGKQQENGKRLVLKLDDDNPENLNPLKKFALLFSSNDINLPRAILSHTNNDALQVQKYCATLTFIPQFNQMSLDDAYSQYLDSRNLAEKQTINRGNYLFIIDRSGSMDGSRIKKAKQSLILFLKSLPQNSLFNIISFGTKHFSLWKESRLYTQGNLQEAIKHVNGIHANMEGTDIYSPLKYQIYNSSYGSSKDTTLNVFLLTDGEDDADPIIELVKNNNRPETRIYTLGIGEGCSFYLIKRVAEVGNGKFHIVGDNEDINEKVIDLLEDSLTPYLEDFKLETNVKEIYSIIPNPESIVSLKKNQELTIQILFSNEQELQNIEFSLNCYNPQDKLPIKYSVNLNLNQSQDNEYFHKLAAHKFITYYDNAIQYGEQQVNFIKLNKQNLEDNDIVNLSIENQVLSNKTAFVCEVCELEDQLKQQARSTIKIIHTTVDHDERHSLVKCCKLSMPIQIQKTFKKAPLLKCLGRPHQEQAPLFECLGQPYEKQAPLLECLGKPYSKQTSYKKQALYSKQIPYKKLAPIPNFSLPIQSLGIHNLQSINMSLSPLPPIKQPQQIQKSFVSEESSSFQQLKSIQSKINNLTYENLMNFAEADGRFMINNDIQRKVNYLNLSNSQGLKVDVWNTFLILLYLEKFCSKFKKSWQLIFFKGVQYLLQNGIDYRQKKQEFDYSYF